MNFRGNAASLFSSCPSFSRCGAACPVAALCLPSSFWRKQKKAQKHVQRGAGDAAQSVYLQRRRPSAPDALVPVQQVAGILARHPESPHGPFGKEIAWRYLARY